MDANLALSAQATDEAAGRERDEESRRRQAGSLKIEELLRLTQFSLDSASDAVSWIDRDARLLYVNQTACRNLGYSREELLSLRLFDIAPNLTPEQWEEYWQRCKHGQVRDETERRTKDGRLLSVEVTGCYLAYGGREYHCSFARDIGERKRVETEQRQFQEKVQQTQKLESLGVLVGGIAHDFNNLLMGILGNAGLALMDLPPDSPARYGLLQIEGAAQHAADLTNQLLAYSGKGKFVVQPLNLSRLVEEMANLLKISISKKANLHYQLERDIPMVEVEPTQIRQVIMNLITNASDALEEREGTLTLSTGVMHADAGYLSAMSRSESLQAGRYVYAEVSDTGCGMDAATQLRIFDPFFSTKFSGRGLGLAAVQGIVRGHKGGVKVTSAMGRGTTFRILLPCADQGEDLSAFQGGGVTSWRGAGTLLIVDDEESVRTVVKMILSEFGFTVLTAADGLQAIELFRSAHRDIAAVILDLTMPHLNGMETFQELRKINPEVKVILSSGYNEAESVSHFTQEGLAGFLQKPYHAAILLEKLREIIGQ